MMFKARRRKRILTHTTLTVAVAFTWNLYAGTAATATRSDEAARSLAPTATAAGKPEEARAARAGEAYGRLPLRFEPNRGQTDGRVRFVSRVGGYNLFLTSDEAVFASHPARPALRMRLAGARTTTSASPTTRH